MMVRYRYTIYRGVLWFLLLIPGTFQVTRAMQHSFVVPTAFQFQTALDKLSISAICRTTGYLAGIGLLYHAACAWAEAARLCNEDAEKEKAMRSAISKAAWRYFVAGCFFSATSFLVSQDAS